MSEAMCGRGHRWVTPGNMLSECPICASEQWQREADWAFLSPLIKAAVREALEEHNLLKGSSESANG